MKAYLSLFYILLLTVTGSVHAFNNYNPPAYQPIESPIHTIQNTLNKLQAFSVNSQNTNPELLRNFIENEITPHFAFDQMTYWIAGPYARHMNTSNMLALEARVKKTFLTSMSTHLGNYNANTTTVRIKRAQYRGPNDAIVSVLLFSPNKRPDQLDFRMRVLGDNWKIVDVQANGTSAALYYRKHFISTLRQYR